MSKTRKPKYYLTDNGKYRIDNYDKASPFSSFLPGVAGPSGVPLWCMYVNRGQAVVSFGAENKDNAIAEFLSATWAYQLVGIQGFRTFCKIGERFYEPFQSHFFCEDSNYTRSMIIDFDRVTIIERNETLGLNFEIEYFSPVNQKTASLVRKVKITNTSPKAQKLQILDGLAVFVPAGLTDGGIKSMRHLNEAYSNVNMIDKNIALASAKVLAHDEAEITKVQHGNFYASWNEKTESLKPVDLITDPGVIFGKGNELVCPQKFIDGTIDPDSQIFENRMPCAFSQFSPVIQTNMSTTLVSLIGFTPDKDFLKKHLSAFKTMNDFNTLSLQSKTLIDEITTPAFTVSNCPLLDNYSKQNYLDNILRGGIPYMLESSQGKVPLHIYSRRHGDLERDYNYFQLPLHPLSSGPGNYRDICQNRRYDLWFYPELFDQEIKMFASLIQADGYNPLEIDGYLWKLEDGVDAASLCPECTEDQKEKFIQLITSDFHPGKLLEWLRKNNIQTDDLLNELNSILKNCSCKLNASGHEGGYWVDHWIYIADMLEAFAGIYPDRIKELLTSKADVSWYYEKAFVNPRSEKYLARDNGPLQLNSVIDLNEKSIDLPQVTLMTKLIALLAVKAVTFDYECKGIEMEAGRPGWNDSLNGLPGLFGSSTCEVAAVARLADWLLENTSIWQKAEVPVIVAEFLEDAMDDLIQKEHDWNRAANIREKYRQKIASNKTSDYKEFQGEKLKQLLTAISKKSRKAIENAVSENSLINTYYVAEPVEPKIHDNGEYKHCSIEKFSQKTLPLFLEGQVHLLRILNDKDKAEKIYNSVKNSPLYDDQLDMYKLNECLYDWPHEIGRARTFSRGWFENESIWLHMSYKYMLELLKSGLYEQFFDDAQTMLVPFMDPQVYGRSILENSSFIASSACLDPDARGKGYIARLSGACAEFIHIWLLLTVGQNPFKYENDQLSFALDPVLPSDWFLKESKEVKWRGENIIIPENSFACAFLGDILLVYHNPQRKDTFGENCVKPAKYILDDSIEVNNSIIASKHVQTIRNHQIKKIDFFLS